MSAEALGRRLREEIEDVPLAQLLFLLNSTRGDRDQKPLPLTWGIRALDEYADLTSRRRAAILQLQGTTANGKTTLIYHLVSKLILPKVPLQGDVDSKSEGMHQNLSGELRGLGTAVVVLDTDGRFSALRLCQVMKGLLPESIVESRDMLISTALSNVHIVRPASSSALLKVIQDDIYDHLHNGRHPSRHRAVGAVVLDSTDAFLWQDRLKLSTMGEAAYNSTSSEDSVWMRLLTSLRKLQRNLHYPLLILSGNHTGALPTSIASQRDVWFDSESNPLVITLKLQRLLVPKFSAGLSFEEADLDRFRRDQVVQKSIFRGEIVNASTSRRTNSDGHRSDEARMAGPKTSFLFTIQDDRVEIINEHES